MKLLVHLLTLSTKAQGGTESNFVGKGQINCIFYEDPSFIMLCSITDLIFTDEEKRVQAD